LLFYNLLFYNSELKALGDGSLRVLSVVLFVNCGQRSILAVIELWITSSAAAAT